MVSQLTNRELVVVDDAEALARRASSIFIELAPRKAALAGGETPRRAYEILAGSEFRWDATQLFLTDERYLPLDHTSSNYRMVNETLGAKVPAVLHHVDTSLAPEEASAQYDQIVREKHPFDFVFLGLGADGHTASIFPGTPASPPDLLADAAFSRATGLWRITLTLEALNAAQDVVFIVAGESKAEALVRMMRGDSIPAAAVSPKGSVTVLADRAAAGR